jgi:hypothetical protein
MLLLRRMNPLSETETMTAAIQSVISQMNSATGGGSEMNQKPLFGEIATARQMRWSLCLSAEALRLRNAARE